MFEIISYTSTLLQNLQKLPKRSMALIYSHYTSPITTIVFYLSCVIKNFKRSTDCCQTLSTTPIYSAFNGNDQQPHKLGNNRYHETAWRVKSLTHTRSRKRCALNSKFKINSLLRHQVIWDKVIWDISAHKIFKWYTQLNLVLPVYGATLPSWLPLQF